jgi:hypothetical protein
MSDLRTLAPRLLAGFDELRPMLQTMRAELQGATAGAVEHVADPLVAARERSTTVAAHLSDLLPGTAPSDPAVMFGKLDPGIGAAMGMRTVPDPGEYGWLYGELADEIGTQAASHVNAEARAIKAFVGSANDRIGGALFALDQGVVTGANVSVRSQAAQGVSALDSATRYVDQLTLDLRAALYGAN